MQMPIITEMISRGTGRGDGVVSVKGSIAVMEHHDPRQLEEASLFRLTLSDDSPSLSKVKAGTWKYELILRPWRNAAYCSLSLFSYRTQVYQPRDGSSHHGLGPLPSVTS